MNVPVSQKFDCIVSNGVLGYMSDLESVTKTLIKCDKMLNTGNTMRFTMLDYPCTAARFFSFRCSVSSARTRIPPSLFHDFGKKHGYTVNIYNLDVMNYQGGGRYMVVLQKLK